MSFKNDLRKCICCLFYKYKNNDSQIFGFQIGKYEFN